MAEISINRESLTKNLEDRYNTQRVGGAFDARSVMNDGGSQPLINSTQEAQFTKPGFQTKLPIGQSQFKNDGEGLSQYVRNLDTRRYKG
jgi:hypothetical protein